MHDRPETEMVLEHLENFLEIHLSGRSDRHHVFIVFHAQRRTVIERRALSALLEIYRLYNHRHSDSHYTYIRHSSGLQI